MTTDKENQVAVFNEMVCEELKSYVYALADPTKKGPLKDRVFYVGKGEKNRAFNHAKEEQVKSENEEPLDEREHKLKTIRKIRTMGKEVEVLIVRHGISSEEALATECALIHLIGETNKVAGHGNNKFWLEKNEIIQLYDNPIQREECSELRGAILFVSLNKSYKASHADPDNAEKLRIMTLGKWNVSKENSRKVDYVIGVKNSLIVSVYEVKKRKDGESSFRRFKQKKKGKHKRSRFFGKEVPQLFEKLRNRTIVHNDVVISKLRPGAGCQFYPALDKSSG